jgi:hypothetical protein
VKQPGDQIEDEELHFVDETRAERGHQNRSRQAIAQAPEGASSGTFEIPMLPKDGINEIPNAPRCFERQLPFILAWT